MRALLAIVVVAGCSDGSGTIVDAGVADGPIDASFGYDPLPPDAPDPDATAPQPDATAAQPDATTALPDATAIDLDAAVAIDAGGCPVGIDDLVPASLAITTDDNTVVYLNGVLIDNTPRIWSDPQRYDVMIYAHPGHPNLLAVEGVNLQNTTGYDRGIVADLRFTIDGAAQTVVTDAAFRVTNTLTAGWPQPGFDDSAWATPFLLGAVGIAPWGAVFASLAPGSAAQWIWTYDPAANPNKPLVESTYARRTFHTVDARCAVVSE